MNNCPCCSNILIRQFRHRQVHWFCRNCWQEMPTLEQEIIGLVTKSSVDTSISILHRSLVTV